MSAHRRPHPFRRILSIVAVSATLGLVLASPAVASETCGMASGAMTVAVETSALIIKDVGKITVKGADGTTVLCDPVESSVTSITVNGSSGNDSVRFLALGSNNFTFGVSPTITVGLSGGTDEVQLAMAADWGNGNIDAGSFASYSSVESITVSGNGYANELRAAAGIPSTLNGYGGSDILIGASGADTLDGEEGNDTLVGGGGNDSFTGGNGTDTLSYDDVSYPGAASAGVTISGLTGSVVSGATSDTATDTFENFTGSSYNDSITGSGQANTLRGLGGSDGIYGGNGDDVIEGGGPTAGEYCTDQMNGDGGQDTLSYENSPSGVYAPIAGGIGGGDGSGDCQSSFENLKGSAYPDTLIGDANANVIEGGGGNDTIVGAGGNDTFTGGGGTDTLSYDDVAYQNVEGCSCLAASAGVTIAGLTGSVVSGATTDTLTDTFENFTGSSYNDVISGSVGANALRGLGGNDSIVGGGGADSIDGGSGEDTVDYSDSTSAITVNLTRGSITGGDASGDTVTNVEIWIGTDYADSLTGGPLAEAFYGGDGGDTLIGNGGADLLDGEAGTDVARGGRGSDTCYAEKVITCELP